MSDMQIAKNTEFSRVLPVQSTGDTDGQVKNPYIPPRKKGKNSTFGPMLDAEISELSMQAAKSIKARKHVETQNNKKG